MLHIDRNNFYGGEGASVNLTNLWKLFRDKEEPNKELGHNRDWNIDLIPKYIMYGGKLVKILLKTRVSKYLEWKRNLWLIQQSTVPTSYSLKKPDFSAREAWRSSKFPLLPRKPSLLTSWDSLRNEDARSSWKLFKTSRKATQRHMTELKLIVPARRCYKSMD